jgi:hypothetical protein
MYMIPPLNMSTMVANFKQDAQNDLNDASGNVGAYIINTQNLLSNAIVKSSSITTNLILAAAINTFTRAVAQMISFPLLEISGKDSLVTQNVPSIILTCAINVSNNALSFLNGFISKINNSGVNINSFATIANNYANTLDSIARSKNLNKYFRDKIQNNLINVISTMIRNRALVAIPSNDPYTPYGIANTGVAAAAEAAAANVRAVRALIVTASSTYTAAAAAAEEAVVAAADAAAAISPFEATKLARNADISAQNARTVSDAMVALITAFNNTVVLESFIASTALNSLSSVRSMINTINTVTSNSSPHAAIAITRRASNTILGELNFFKEQETASLEAAADANSVLVLLNTAYNLTASITDLTSIQNKHWAVNAASAKASEVSEKLKQRSFLLSRTAHTIVTPAKIAVQTSTANNLGMLNISAASRLDRISREVYPLPPPAYNGFKADIRAKILEPVRPSLDELVYNNRIQPLRLDSLRTILDNKIKVAQEVQRVKDQSAASYRLQ